MNMAKDLVQSGPPRPRHEANRVEYQPQIIAIIRLHDFLDLAECSNHILYHSALKRNLMKVWKTWAGPSQGGRAWSRSTKSALSEILHNKEYFY